MLSCAERTPVRNLQREQLFSLGYGVLEDQINLFSLDGKAPPAKTRIAMRDGIFFVANGNAGKVLSFSSFGDLLTMIYNPDRNPQPMLLQVVPQGETAQGRIARPYPFNIPGEIIVNSTSTIFIEDRVPEGRSIYDQELQARLDTVVLRFSRDGEYRDYLGQEGVGGTPFPMILGLHMTDNDECVVVCITGRGWIAYWFDPAGFLVSSITIQRIALPVPQGRDDLLPSVDAVFPSRDGRGLIVKIDYFREIIDQETRTRAGIEFASSYAWRMNHLNGEYTGNFEIPAFESLVAVRRKQQPVPRSWDFAGITATHLFLTAVDEDAEAYYAMYDLSTGTMRRFSLAMDSDELHYTAFAFSPEGILTGLLGSSYEARFVWWRFDRVAGGTVP
jgi:hypothetical protein